MSKYIVLVLIAISGTVAVMLMRRRNAWPLICVYWVVLTIKNIVDFAGW